MTKPVLLVVDDDRNTREGLEKALSDRYDVYLAESAERALQILDETTVHAMLSDVRMPGMDGLALLQRALARTPQPVCILMTAYGTIDTAVEAMKRGAADYVTKPYNLEDLEMRLGKALRSRAMESENEILQAQLDDKYGLENLIGNSEPMRRVFEIVRQAAPTQATVLLTGESGTGKELVAHAIHRLSGRSKGPFVAVHCAALSQSLIESELFGHEKGAFTGANERRIGRFEMADGGTFFLDEVSEIPPSTQAKLLRVLEERRFERVGGSRSLDVDLRLVAATNKDLRDLVAKGNFRSDLYFRMNVVNIELPPLRSRPGDIPLLCRHFVRQLAREHGKPVEEASAEVVAILQSYAWPGNVRELRNAIEQMIVLSRGPRLTPRDIPPEIRQAAGAATGRQDGTGAGAIVLSGSLEEAERAMIQAALKATRNNKSQAAVHLGISRRTLHRKLKEYREPPSPVPGPGAGHAPGPDAATRVLPEGDA